MASLHSGGIGSGLVGKMSKRERKLIMERDPLHIPSSLQPNETAE